MNTKWMILVLLVLTLSGCAWGQGFLHGIADPTGVEGTEAGQQVGQSVGTVLETAVPFMPSPWRELVTGALGVVAGFFGHAAREKKKEEEK